MPRLLPTRKSALVTRDSQLATAFCKAPWKARRKAHSKARSRASLKAHFRASFKARFKAHFRASRKARFKARQKAPRKARFKAHFKARFKAWSKAWFKARSKACSKATPRAVSSPYPPRGNCGSVRHRTLHIDYHDPCSRIPQDPTGPNLQVGRTLRLWSTPADLSALGMIRICLKPSLTLP